MPREQTYGASFVRHLTTLGRRTPSLDADLRRVKAMSQAELADWIGGECREFSQVVRDHPADVAAEMVHRKRSELASGSTVATAAECAVSFLELLAGLFS